MWSYLQVSLLFTQDAALVLTLLTTHFWPKTWKLFYRECLFFYVLLFFVFLMYISPQIIFFIPSNKKKQWLIMDFKDWSPSLISVSYKEGCCTYFESFFSNRKQRRQSKRLSAPRLWLKEENSFSTQKSSIIISRCFTEFYFLSTFGASDPGDPLWDSASYCSERPSMICTFYFCFVKKRESCWYHNLIEATRQVDTKSYCLRK